MALTELYVVAGTEEGNTGLAVEVGEEELVGRETGELTADSAAEEPTDPVENDNGEMVVDRLGVGGRSVELTIDGLATELRESIPADGVLVSPAGDWFEEKIFTVEGPGDEREVLN